MKKKCNKCCIEKELIEDNFNRHPTTTDGWLNQCKLCRADWRKGRREKIAQQQKEYRKRIKEETIVAYGGICTCCGENRKQFLTIEHLNGRDETNKDSRSYNEYARLRSLGYPKDGITVLCYNCNCAKNIYGSCPHTW